MNRPDFIIIGAMKAGTTSLYAYLDLHPEIAMTTVKEVRFFTTHWEKGVDWYTQQFSHTEKVQGEASPQYTFYPKWENTPERMHSVCPDVKLIYLLRDPINRIVSHYAQRMGSFAEHRELDVVLDDFENDRAVFDQYISPSQYHMQIERYLEYFDRDRLHVITLEELRDRPMEVLNEIFEFIGADPSTFGGQELPVLNTSSSKYRKNWLGHVIYPPAVRKFLLGPYGSHRVAGAIKKVVGYAGGKFVTPKLSDRLGQRIAAAVEDDVNQLQSFLGRDFPQWTTYHQALARVSDTSDTAELPKPDATGNPIS